MKRLIFLLAFVISTTLQAQQVTVVNGLYVDVAGQVFTGTATEFYATGAKKADIAIIQGKMNGVATYYHENGNRMEAGIYTNGLRNGSWESWNAAGSKTGEASYLLFFRFLGK